MHTRPLRATGRPRAPRGLDPRAAIRPRVEPHDINQLELKLGYVVKPGRRREQYSVETFIFVPRTLGLNRHTYKGHRFYADMAAFLRLRTPQVPLAALARAGEAEEWFDPLRAGLRGPARRDPQRARRLARRLKILGCVYRSALRDDAHALRRQLRAAPARDPLAEGRMQETLARRLRRFHQHLTRALERLRALDRGCRARGEGEVVHDSWRAVDEYSALLAEEACNDIIEACDLRVERAPLLHPELAAARQTLASAAVRANAYRRERGYRSQLLPRESNEAFPHWRRTLKRVVYSALYLDVRHQEVGRLAYDLVGMIAAMLAMAFAVSVSILAQTELDIFSGAFVAIMIVSYMIKDRIKDWGKRYGGRKIARLLPDTIVRVYDAEGDRALGVCRESFWILNAEKVDADVFAARHCGRVGAVEQQGTPETVIHYAKEVTLRSAPLRDELAGLEGLHDIIRYNVGHLRSRMDAPREDHRLLDPSTGAFVVVPCARVYYLNVVLRVTSGRGPRARRTIERVRVVMDQRGIKRVEFLGRDRAHETPGRDRTRSVEPDSSSFALQRDAPSREAHRRTPDGAGVLPDEAP